MLETIIFTALLWSIWWFLSLIKGYNLTDAISLTLRRIQDVIIVKKSLHRGKLILESGNVNREFIHISFVLLKAKLDLCIVCFQVEFEFIFICRCNYINFRKNVACLKCDHRRPKANNSFATSTQPNNSNGENRQSRPYFGQGRQVEDARADKWIFVEDGKEDQDASNSWNVNPGLVDFPVVGGKTDLSQNVSQNVQQQARWKHEMAERNNNVVEAKGNADEFKAAIMERRRKFSETAQDEEMAGWFGCNGSEGRNFD